MSTFAIDRRKLLIASQALAAAALLPMTAGPASAQTLTKMTYLTPFGYLIGFAETMYANTGGIFAKNGLDVTIEGGRGSAMAVQQVTAGNALLSRTGGTDLIKAYATDPSIVAVAEIYQRDIFYVISAKAAPIMKPQDMVGKTIGIVSAGGATENILNMMLVGSDVPVADVPRQVVGNAPAAFELVKQGRIAAFIATNDTLFQLQVDKQDVAAFSTDDFALSPGQVYMTSKAQLEKNRSTIAAFLKAVYETLGVLTTTTNLDPVIASMLTKYQVFESARPDKGLTVLENSVKAMIPPYRDKLASNPKAWSSAYGLMVKAKLIPTLSDQNFYDDSARALAFK